MSTLFTPVTIAALVATGCVSQKRHDALKADYATLASIHEAASEGYEVQIETLRERIEHLAVRNTALAAYYRDLIREFGPAMERGELSLIVYPDHISLALHDDIHFDSGEATLNDVGRATLAEIAGFISAHPDRTFQIEGHTDDRPIRSGAAWSSNWPSFQVSCQSSSIATRRWMLGRQCV